MPSLTPLRGVYFVSLHVVDLARARPFYENVLGFAPTKVIGDEEVLYDMLGVGLSVHVDPEGECGRLPGGPTGIYLLVDDVERAKRDLRAAGVPIVFENDFSVEIADPDGNGFVLFQRRVTG